MGVGWTQGILCVAEMGNFVSVFIASRSFFSSGWRVYRQIGVAKFW